MLRINSQTEHHCRRRRERLTAYSEPFDNGYEAVALSYWLTPAPHSDSSAGD